MREYKYMNIFHKFPQLCEYGLKDKTESNKPISWYKIDCGNGWYDVIIKTLSEIRKYCKSNNILDKVRVSQIKEKFGGIRIYFDYSDIDRVHIDNINSYVTDAEKQAYKTCEICGRPGKLNKKHRYIVVCWRCKMKVFFKRINIFKKLLT